MSKEAPTMHKDVLARYDIPNYIRRRLYCYRFSVKTDVITDYKTFPLGWETWCMICKVNCWEWSK